MGDLGQCGLLPCDHSKIITDEKTGNEYRYCMKLQIPVDFYDSCKYYSREKRTAFLQQWTSWSEKREANTKKDRKINMKLFIFIFLIILVYFFLR